RRSTSSAPPAVAPGSSAPVPAVPTTVPTFPPPRETTPASGSPTAPVSETPPTTTVPSPPSSSHGAGFESAPGNPEPPGQAHRSEPHGKSADKTTPTTAG